VASFAAHISVTRRHIGFYSFQKPMVIVGQRLDERGSSSTKQTPAKHRIAPAKSDGLPARLSNPLNTDSAMMNGRQFINP
jgi:hypothetical protein